MPFPSLDNVELDLDGAGLEHEPYMFRVEGDNDFEWGIPGRALEFAPLAIGQIAVPSMTPLAAASPPAPWAQRRKKRHAHRRRALRHNATIAARR